MTLQSLRARTCAAFSLLVAGLLLVLCFVLTTRARAVEEHRANATLLAARQRLAREWTASSVLDGPRLLRRARESAQEREAAEDAQSLALLLIGPGGVLYRSAGHAPQWPLPQPHDAPPARPTATATSPHPSLQPRDAKPARNAPKARPETAPRFQQNPVNRNPLPALNTPSQASAANQVNAMAPKIETGEVGDWKVVSVRRGDISAVLALPRFKAKAALRAQWESLLTLSGVVLLGAVFGSWLLVGHTLSPIKKLSRQARDAARQVSSTSRLQLQAPSADMEMTELVGTLNGMLGRLAQNAEARGRFYAAASHELRTPLQALTGHLGLALSRERPAQEYRAALEEACAQSGRLASLVQDLLRLNQLEMATSTPPCELLDLADLAQSVLRPLCPLVEERGLQLQTLWPLDCEVSAPPNHLEMLVRNLIENAVKYAPDGGRVRLGASRDALGLELQVFNECPTMDAGEAEMARWFEPFYRPDAARRSQTGGSGLGLAICRALAEANGWKIALSRSENGVRATVRFSHAATDEPERASLPLEKPEREGIR